METKLTKEAIRNLAAKISVNVSNTHGRKPSYYSYKLALRACMETIALAGIDAKTLPEF